MPLSDFEQEILNKIKKIPRDPHEEPHECDNKPSPFKDLTLEEKKYLQEHIELLELIKNRRK